jgi:hypothetical protein|tara:strand:- start:6344 stop:6517 length:174 start_codon:yes stop_codon:yes gene_type:complete
MIMYITTNGNLYRIEEYTWRGYADSMHTSNTITKIPANEVTEIKKLMEEKGEKVQKR